MSQSVCQEDLQPYSTSAYAWRWQDPNHTILPIGVLNAIQVIRTEKARELFPRSLDLDKWAREAPARVIDVETSAPTETATWLRQLAPSDTQVVVSWHQDDAVSFRGVSLPNTGKPFGIRLRTTSPSFRSVRRGFFHATMRAGTRGGMPRLALSQESRAAQRRAEADEAGLAWSLAA